ncbi:hypothetical protein NR640_005420 [Pseudomonas aeruginosa]|uniref:hypothetical protein n=1 Tax=Pseudomonas aeruginosa TaxID=287 RepID=UPI000AAEBC53|nr:hypothetical protein [Pseudomonas aeruginosa]EKT9083153.1 hypothetical protein [Pseudomonas aeruginosa]ELQ7809064.1 hypothetical protein [Pseudomonas aeruginosa]MBG6606792.1 hypothetical protein [Pseudomonas aeruginosa]MBG7029752.1 hypothetical protein [Pseudomonas aeruginosa]MBG7327970.1 hypothetical protein [Pseudomonas aeruginosa]
MSKLEICPLTLAEANAFVEQHHRHHGPVQGHKFSLGLAAGMTLRDALTTPRQQPKPGRRHPWIRSQKEHTFSDCSAPEGSGMNRYFEN